MSAPLVIRPATQADVPQILQFIIDLCIFEKEDPATTVKATIENLSSTLGFTGKQYAKALMGYEPSNPEKSVGMAIYFYNYSTWNGGPGIYLEDLYIDPEYRSKGFGTKFLSHLAKICKEEGCERLELSVLKWNEKAIRVYEGAGAFNMGKEWDVMRYSGDSLEKLAAKSV